MTGLCECGCGATTRIPKHSDASKDQVGGRPLRFIDGHNKRNPRPRYIADAQTGCWVWQHYLDPHGYGRCKTGRSSLAHRNVYEEHRGPIPEGLTLDHLCRNPPCVNPDHLEPVTNAENSRRGNMTRLTREQVDEIRASTQSQNELAALYGITPQHVGQIRLRHCWVAA